MVSPRGSNIYFDMVQFVTDPRKNEIIISNDLPKLPTVRQLTSSLSNGMANSAGHLRLKNQEALAVTWLDYTYKYATAVALFAVSSLFLHKIPWIKPEGPGEMVQLISS